MEVLIRYEIYKSINDEEPQQVGRRKEGRPRLFLPDKIAFSPIVHASSLS